eukprot:2950028-Prymnesium_polylepis.2
MTLSHGRELRGQQVAQRRITDDHLAGLRVARLRQACDDPLRVRRLADQQLAHAQVFHPRLRVRDKDRVVRDRRVDYARVRKHPVEQRDPHLLRDLGVAFALLHIGPRDALLTLRELRPLLRRVAEEPLGRPEGEAVALCDERARARVEARCRAVTLARRRRDRSGDALDEAAPVVVGTAPLLLACRGRALQHPLHLLLVVERHLDELRMVVAGDRSHLPEALVLER